MTRSCEGHFGLLTEFVDGSRTSNRRQDTKDDGKNWRQPGVAEFRENNRQDFERRHFESFLTAQSDSGSWQICTMKNVFMLRSSNRKTN